MKRFYVSLLMFFTCFLCLASCSKKEVVKPETVVQQHLRSLAENDIENAAKLVYQPEDITNPAYYQQKIRDVLTRDKQEMDNRGGFEHVAIKDVLTRFTNGEIKDGQPEFIKRNEADKGSTAIVTAMVVFQNGTYKEAVYPLRHTGEEYRIVLAEIPVQ